ncbi:MAG: 30S ribosomal protein S17 [Deltaproteobacteria bacterium]|nr:30S ribosomal protein S17 [Deltaproteobacteria bacterium]
MTENKTKVKSKVLIGSVLSEKMDKTVVVSIERLKKHARYGKYLKRRIKYMAHDENNECKCGDKVAIVQSRPLSSRKRWRVKEIVEKAK